MKSGDYFKIAQFGMFKAHWSIVQVNYHLKNFGLMDFQQNYKLHAFMHLSVQKSDKLKLSFQMWGDSNLNEKRGEWRGNEV